MLRSQDPDRCGPRGASRARARARELTDRFAERFEWHYTPKHGSWLDMAEIRTWCAVLPSVSIGVFQDKQALIEEVAAWENSQRQEDHAKAKWQFTTADPRIKLEEAVPSFMKRLQGTSLCARRV